MAEVARRADADSRSAVGGGGGTGQRAWGVPNCQASEAGLWQAEASGGMAEPGRTDSGATGRTSAGRGGVVGAWESHYLGVSDRVGGAGGQGAHPVERKHTAGPGRPEPGIVGVCAKQVAPRVQQRPSPQGLAGGKPLRRIRHEDSCSWWRWGWEWITPERWT